MTFPATGRVVLIVAVVALSLGASLLAQENRGERVVTEVFGIGEEARLFVHDLDGDDFPEIVVLNLDEGDVLVLRSRAAGSYELSQTLETIPGARSLAFGALGFDADPQADIVDYRPYSSTLGISLGDGTGVFPRAHTEFILEGGASPLLFFVWGDLDGDEKLDLVTRRRGGSGLVVYAPLSTSEPLPVPISVTSPERGALGDFDGDGHGDIAVWGPGAGAFFSVLLGDADGTFREGLTRDRLPPPGGVPLGAVSADFDGDGRPEAAVVAGDLPRLATRGALYLFDLEAERPLVRLGGEIPLVPANLNQTVDLQAVDFDADGHVDLLLDVLHEGERAWWLLRHRGTPEPSFAAPCVLRPREAGGSFVFADMNADGFMDTVEVLPEGDRVIVEFFPGRVCEPLEECYSPRSFSDGLFREVAAADVTGDGASEVIVAGSEEVRVFSAGPDGLVESLRIEGLSSLGALTVGDLDGAGPDDIVLGGDGSLELLLVSEANGGFERRSIAVEGRVSGLLVGDLDGDDTEEILASSRDPDRVLVLRRGRDGSFAVDEEIAAGPSPGALELADVTGDGALDLVLVNEGTAQVTLLPGDGAGGFAPPVSLRVISDAVAVATLDLDGDDAREIAVLSRRTNGITLLDHTGDRFRLFSYELPEASFPSDIVVADLDRDGREELLVASSSSDEVFVLGPSAEDPFTLARGPTLTFGFAAVVDSAGAALAVADLSRDGWPDVATVRGGEPGVRVHWSTGCGRESDFRRGDVDADGSVTLTDAIRGLRALFLGETELVACADAADADDDGRPSLTDAIVILSYLFSTVRPGLPPPGPEVCGPDETADELPSCEAPCL